MLKRTIVLDFLADILWNMMIEVGITSDRNKNQARGIILDIEPTLNSNKIQAIKDLRTWANSTVKVHIPVTMGNVIRSAMCINGKLYTPQSDYIVFESPNRLGLKDAKDFVDMMDILLKETETKDF